MLNNWSIYIHQTPNLISVIKLSEKKKEKEDKN